MAYRNKTYVCFDADTDIRMYRLMQAWRDNEHHEFNFYDAHDLNTIRPWSNEDSIKRNLRERMASSKVLIVLIGENTKNLHKFVRWEIEIAINLGLPIIAVNLNRYRGFDNNLCPAILRNELAIHISYGAKIITYALDNWPILHSQHRRNNQIGPFRFNESIYNQLQIQ